MNSFIKICGLVASLQFLGIQAPEAATLSIAPNTQSVTLGQAVSVNVDVGDLGVEQVGAYDFFITYDSGFLTFSGVNFGSFLGYESYPPQGIIDDSTSGMLNVAEMSLLSDLSAQPASSRCSA